MGEIKNLHPQQRNDLIVKSNALIESSYKLGVVEHKLVRFVASKIKKDDDDFHTYTISVKEFAAAVGVRGKSLYEELEHISAEILKKPLTFRIGERTIQVPWFSYISYNPGEGTVDIRFDKFFKPHLLNLKEKFTKYNFKYISSLKSNYSIRIYELLKQRQALGVREFTIDELKSVLSVKDLYKDYSNFKKRVILPAEKELKEKSDIYFDYEEIKKGRRVFKIRFHIKTNSSNKIDLDILLPKEEDETKLFISNIQKQAKNYDLFINDEIVETWERYGTKAVLNIFEQIKLRDDIDNAGAYISKVLKSLEENSVLEKSDIEDRIVKTIVQTIKNRFSRDTSPIPDYMVAQEFQEMIMEKMAVDQVLSKKIWNEYSAEIMEYIKLEMNKNRRKASKTIY